MRGVHIALMAVMALVAAGMLPTVSAAAPTITGYVAPSTGTVNDQFVFVAKYTGKFNATSVTLHVNDGDYPMAEVDSGDTNVSNGKEYQYKTHLPSGANVYYFEVLDANGTVVKSNAAAIAVDPWFNFDHVDVALVMAVFMVPAVIIMFLLYRTMKAMERIAIGKRQLEEQRASEGLKAAVAHELSKEEKKP